MKMIKNHRFGLITILFVAIVVLLRTHLGFTVPEDNELDNESNIENHIHTEAESDEHEQELTVGQTDEQAHVDNDEHAIQLDSAQMDEYGIKIATAGPGTLNINATFPGEVVFNAERFSHISPYVSGIVREVRKKIGDKVKEGEIMAVIDSRELSEIQSSFLVAREYMTLAETTYKREERLWNQNISSEKEYLDAKQAYAEARIELEVAEQKLHSLGYDEQYLEGLSFNSEHPLTYYEIRAPFDGDIIERHITIGEAVSEDTEIFMIADLSTVWVDLTIYQKNIAYINIGQPVSISADEQNLFATEVISYISPIMDKETRTVKARIELKNPDFLWRPGLFIKGNIPYDDVAVEVLIPKSATFMMDNEIVVFIQDEDGFENQPVILGKTDETNVEVISGISAGQEYVIEGGFELKAQIETAGLGSHAGHGH